MCVCACACLGRNACLRGCMSITRTETLTLQNMRSIEVQTPACALSPIQPFQRHRLKKQQYDVSYNQIPAQFGVMLVVSVEVKFT